MPGNKEHGTPIRHQALCAGLNDDSIAVKKLPSVSWNSI
jgi:hypothetical protein